MKQYVPEVIAETTVQMVPVERVVTRTEYIPVERYVGNYLEKLFIILNNLWLLVLPLLLDLFLVGMLLEDL